MLADQVAVLAADEARRLVHACAGMADHGRDGVLGALERAAQRSGAAIGLAVLAAVVDHTAAHPPARTACPCPGHRGADARLVARRPKTVRTLLGPLPVVRGYYHCRTCEHGFAPVDDLLGVAGTRLSPGMARACATAGAEMPYDRSRQLIATVTGLDLASTSTITRTTRTHGRRARALEATEHGTPPPPTTPAHDHHRPDKCYVLIDGTGAPMLPSECRDRQGKDGRKATTREVKIGCLFTQTHTDPATGAPVQDPGSATYVSTFDPCGPFGDLVKAEYLRRGLDHVRQPVVIGDGAHWIWAIADTHFPAATQVVDYYHAREHLADLVKLLTPLLCDPATFETTLADLLDLGHTNHIAAAVAALDLPTTAPDLAKAATTEVGYFTGNHHRMQYADFRANGYYIGSGPVESACNTIVKQ